MHLYFFRTSSDYNIMMNIDHHELPKSRVYTSIVCRWNRCIRRWTSHIENLIGMKVEPHLVILIATMLILSVQYFLFISATTKSIDCKIPTVGSHIDRKFDEKLPTIYVVTPTYSRYVQKAELIRLSQTLMLVPNVHWIIVEDSNQLSELVIRFVAKLQQQYDFKSITHLNEQTPAEFKLKPGDPRWKYPKGIWQRNRALKWIYANEQALDQSGVIYFADDDNTYDLELFHEMRFTRKVSVWPVGFSGGLLVERPIVLDGKVNSFNSLWERTRPFPIDMAGFSINLQFLLRRGSNVSFSSNEKIGYVESHFLSQLINSWTELEPKANGCTKILVWHTQSKNPTLHEEIKLLRPSFQDLEW